MIKFNINGYVRVKLTKIGHEILFYNHVELFANNRLKPIYTRPIEDNEGWSKWQLWDLMSQIGGSFHNGFNNAIETEIEILTD